MSSPNRHDHGHHDHGHHDHAHASFPREATGRAFAVAIGLNVSFVAVEFAYGFAANSTALMADAGHNLSDVLGLVLAWGAMRLEARRPTVRFTYGLRGSSILAALANSLLLMLACGAIAWEAVERLAAPPTVASTTVMAVAAVGIAVNGLSAWLFARGREHDLNVRGAYLHMLADAAVSLGVVLAGAVMMATGWYAVDPLVSLVIVAVIAWSTWGLLRDSVAMALNAVPRGIDPGAVVVYLGAQPGVASVHDLHIWGLSTTETAMTAHLVMPAGLPGDETIDRIADELRERFGIHHVTLQVERGTTNHGCSLQGGAAGAAVRP